MSIPKALRTAVFPGTMTLLVMATSPSCGPSDPLPDHLGLFVVEGREIHEITTQDPASAATINTDPEDFIAFFEAVATLDDPLDHFILYDQELSPGNVLVTRLAPAWEEGKFSASDQEVRLQIQPVEKAMGMYRLRPAEPLEPGFYVIGGAEEGGFLGQRFRYFGAVCANCATETVRETLETNTKAVEAIRVTMENMRAIGTAMFMWQMDNKSESPGGSSGWSRTTTTPLSLTDRRQISASDLRELLEPNFLVSAPMTDGWGNHLEFYINREELDSKYALVMRSSGSDGEFQKDSYEPGTFPPHLHEEDVVWADGLFVRYPEGN